jgi:diguanylate cyclase (GGDEF)-like protein/putative nucleotidyltransferase with HDIG domain
VGEQPGDIVLTEIDLNGHGLSAPSRLQDLVLSNVDGAVLINRKNIILFANPAAERLFEKRPEGFLGRPFPLQFVVNGTIEQTLPAEGGEAAVVEIRAKATSQSDDADIVVSIRDITERKKAEEKQLEAALSDLKFALASEKVLLDELDKKNKELIELSITDGLTGLYNHRFIQERFEFEFKRTKRYGGHLACMMIDIDHFKSINDTYGHQFGDLVLREIAGIIQSRSREVDICGRYGGEEFMIITNVILEYAMTFATKIHAAIDQHRFMADDKSVHVTVSIGLADFREDLKTRHEFIEHADQALYRAKEDGRNLIRIWKEQSGADEPSIDHISVQELKTKFVSLSQQVRASYMEYTNALVKAVDAKDPFTREHSQNVSRYAVAIARELALAEKDCEIIKYAGLLHDIGKISIPCEILLKTQPLTPEEYKILQKHPMVGVTIVKDIKFLEKEIPIILHHHERFDGKGYPQGLMGREIPVGARIVAAADAFDAMTSGRGYKAKLAAEGAVEELKRGSGSQFAPEVVEAFIRVLEKK